MPFDSNGVFSLTPGYTAVAGQTIQPSQHNPPLEDISAGGLSLVLVRDGRAPMTGNLNMNGFKLTNVLAGTSALDAVNKTQLDAQSAAYRGYIYGLTLSNSAVDPTNDIDIAPGGAAQDTTAPVIMTLASTLTKRLDANWAVGTNAGGLDTGSIANGTYHVWLIQRSDTGIVDALFSLSATAPTMPANYDRKRRVGAILRESGAIVRFLQSGDLFLRAKVTDVSVVSFYAATGTTMSVPALIQVQPIIGIQVTAGASASDVTLAMGSGTDLSTEIIGVLRALSGNTASGWISSGIVTNTSRQIYTAVIGSGTVAGVIVTTKGWIDTRGSV